VRTMVVLVGVTLSGVAGRRKGRVDVNALGGGNRASTVASRRRLFLGRRGVGVREV